MSILRHPVEAHVPSLRRYARALRGSAADADDLVQDTLERAHSRWHLWRRGTDLRPWLFAIMHNVFVNQLKVARGRGEATSLDAAAELSVPASQDSVGARLDLGVALARLTDLEREALLLVALEGFAHAEAARVLEVPVGTVMSRLARARERLRALTGGEDASERRGA